MAGEVQTLVGGLRAVELHYRQIRDVSSGNPAFLQSQTRLNTPGLGVLTPENFRDVAEITNQCITLFDLEVVQALEAIKKFTEREVQFNWLSVYMPAEYLRDIHAERNVMEFCERFEVHTNKVCFELPLKLLYQLILFGQHRYLLLPLCYFRSQLKGLRQGSLQALSKLFSLTFFA